MQSSKPWSPSTFHVVKIFPIIDKTQNFIVMWNTAGTLTLSWAKSGTIEDDSSRLWYSAPLQDFIMLVRLSDWTNRDGRGMWNVWGTRQVNTGFLRGILRERGLFENLGVDGPIILTWVLRDWVGTARIGFIWIKKGKYGESLWQRFGKFLFRQMGGILG
jgi:hypothetical protein